MSNELATVLVSGLSVTGLGEMFGMTGAEVKARLSGKVSPIQSGALGTRYRIKDAAPFLVTCQIDPEDLFKNLVPSKWPAPLQDAFWKAQINKQKWEETRGDLWRTQRVYQVITSAFKVIRLTILMFVDTVEQRTELSADQRRILLELGDGLLASLNKTLTEEFAFYQAPHDEHGPSLNLNPTMTAVVDEHDPFA